MYGSQSAHAWLPYICLLVSGFLNVYHFACVWPTALKRCCITNFDMLCLVMGFISLVDEIQFLPYLHKDYNFFYFFIFLHRLVFHEFLNYFKMRANSPFLRPSKTFGTDLNVFSFNRSGETASCVSCVD